MNSETICLSKILFYIFRNTTKYTNVVFACDGYQKSEVTQNADIPMLIYVITRKKNNENSHCGDTKAHNVSSIEK